MNSRVKGLGNCRLDLEQGRRQLAILNWVFNIGSFTFE